MSGDFKEITSFEYVSVLSNIEAAVEIEKEMLEKDVYVYTFQMKWDEEQAKEEDSQIRLLWTMRDCPRQDVQYMWHPNVRAYRALEADWRISRGGISSCLTGSAPVAGLFTIADENAYTVALDEITKTTRVLFGPHEDDNAILGEIWIGLKQYMNQNSHKIRVRVDYRRIPYYEAIRAVGNWWEEVCDIHPLEAPETAKLPMYNTTYNFRETITDKDLEEELEVAVQMGMKAVILDGSWAWMETPGSTWIMYNGEWDPDPEEFPDLRKHVDYIHSLGMKYLMWFGLPFLDVRSEEWESLKDKILMIKPSYNSGILDPRYPEARDRIIRIYEKTIRKYDIDGLKLDYVDMYSVPNFDVKPGMDYTDVQEGFARLMEDMLVRLKKMKPEIMIEFRQKYIGPKMKEYANMFRVGDCAMDITANRVGIADLRLLSGNCTAVHSDMIAWSDRETPENAALQLLNCMFGTIQYSKFVTKIPQSHKKMSAFWLQFAVENKKVLQESELIPYESYSLYPVIKAQDENTAIIGIYAPNKVISYDTSRKHTKIMNATKEETVLLRVPATVTVKKKVTDCMGEVQGTEEITLETGFAELKVPQSGLLELEIL